MYNAYLKITPPPCILQWHVLCSHQTHSIDLPRIKLACMLQIRSTWVIFTSALFHADWRYNSVAVAIQLKYKIHIWMQLYSKWLVQAYTHVHNAVPLMKLIVLPSVRRCCRLPLYWCCCRDYICNYCSYILHSWGPGYGSRLLQYQQVQVPNLQARVILPRTATSNVISQSTATNRSRIWGGDRIEWEQGLQTCKEHWNEGKWSLSACATMIYC